MNQVSTLAMPGPRRNDEGHGVPYATSSLWGTERRHNG